MAYAEGFVTGTFGPPWQYPSRYVENSPYMLLNKLTTPILLHRGSRGGFTGQGDQLFAALSTRTRQPATYLTRVKRITQTLGRLPIAVTILGVLSHGSITGCDPG